MYAYEEHEYASTSGGCFVACSSGDENSCIGRDPVAISSEIVAYISWTMLVFVIGGLFWLYSARSL